MANAENSVMPSENEYTNTGRYGRVDLEIMSRMEQKCGMERVRVESWNVCGFEGKERKPLEIVEQAEQSNLDAVGIRHRWS